MDRAEARIGPSAVLQTLRAVEELEPRSRAAVESRAPMEPLEEGMIPERVFVQLIRAVRDVLPRERAEAVLRRSGALTADDVRSHRIPAAIRATLAGLPAFLAMPLILQAIERHAWTFAGAGTFGSEGKMLLLDGAPTARPESGPPGTGCSCAYYEGAFEGLLRLAAREVRVTEVACQASGAAKCQFRIQG
ncbi:MAG: bacteriochlorophyll 4-vinyl reductase [Myxococcaceae bacterium]